MSITIYSGYLVKSGLSPFAVQSEVQQVLAPIANSLNGQLLLDATVTAYDAKVRSNEPAELYDTFWDVLETESSEFHSRSSISSLTNAQVGLFWNPIRNEQYAYFSGSGELEERFAGLSCIAGEFGYWNSSDSYVNLGLTQEQWTDRLKAWEEAIDIQKSLETQGLYISLLSEYEILGWSPVRIRDGLEEGSLKFPSREERLKNVARDLWFAEKMKVSVDQTLFVGEAMQLLRDFADLEVEELSIWVNNARPFVKNINFN